MSDRKSHPMCSKEWVEFARNWMIGAAEGKNLDGIDMSYSEIFTNAPVKADPAPDGKASWYIHIHDDRIDIDRGILDQSILDQPAHTFLVSEGEYELIHPIAKMVINDDKELRKQAYKRLDAAGVERKGELSVITALDWTRGLHDALAEVTE